MRRQAEGIGLAIVGAGRVGLFRGETAARHPAVEWIGIASAPASAGGGNSLYLIGRDTITGLGVLTEVQP